MSISRSRDTHGYNEPTEGVVSCLPSSWVPYAELMRLNKPVGVINIYLPYLFGSLFAACTQYPVITPLSVLSANAKLFSMAFLLRSAGCTWNDIIDRDLDRKVTRCRLRPMARNAVSPRNGYIFYAAQMLVWLVMILQTDTQTIFYACPAVLLGHFYPFAKRITDYPQVVLGFALSWGVLVGCMLQGISPTTLAVKQPSTAVALACLCLSSFSWTVTHDTVYGFQDIQDDSKAGIKSMCQRYESQVTALLLGLAVVQVGSHVATGMAIRAGFLYYLGTCLGTAALLGCLIWRVDVKDPQQCWWWFHYGSLIIGWTITAGLIGEYRRKLHAVERF